VDALANDLKAWRRRLKITQAAAARLLDVPLRTYQGWEIGRAVDRPHVLRLAMAALEAGEEQQ